MLIKKQGHPRSILNEFDLLGNKETSLSKAFAFVLGKKPNALFAFLQFLKVPINNTNTNFSEISINTEYYRKEGRTDIEIYFKNRFHIIIESKIRGNKVRNQRTQYLSSFNPEVKTKILCFITQEHDINKQIDGGIEILNLSWFDITTLYDKKAFTDNDLIKKFLHYISKNYKMNEQKEILIQDISLKDEIDRFMKYNIYKRDQTFGSPLYFAPYFTRKLKQPEGEGIPYLAKILGILTLVPSEIDNYEEDLLRFSGERETVDNWIKGVKLNLEAETSQQTFYFLEEPLRLNRNLMKDGGIEKGRGKNWIAAKIPKNRCVSFKEFTRRLMMD